MYIPRPDVIRIEACDCETVRKISWKEKKKRVSCRYLIVYAYPDAAWKRASGFPRLHKFLLAGGDRR